MTILYNTEFQRWEVYGDNPVIRAGEPQPCYVSAERAKCEAYKEKVEGRHGRLIDASENIGVMMYDEEHEDWTRHDMTIDELLGQGWIDADAPTIIPAEERE